MKYFLFAISIWIVIPLGLSAQTNDLFIPRNMKKSYENGVRSLDGKPGKNYWQNKADYNITAEFIPSKRIISGTEKIDYWNNSPDRLTFLYIRLYPDIFRKDVKREININKEDLNEGVIIKKIVVNGETYDVEFKSVSGPRKFNTNLSVPLKTSIEAGKKCTVEIEWEYTMPLKTNLRGGIYSPTAFVVSYWYPQIAVYDDIDGWDRNPYKGTLNFYNDFNSYNVKIQTPDNYIVWATGVLQNEEENFSGKIISKIKEAKKSEQIISIISKEEADNNDLLKKADKHVWHYKAENVNDFTFSAGSGMVWDASGVELSNGNNVFVSSIYHKNTKYCEDIALYARKAIDYFANIFPAVPYPFPSMTVFNHSGGGGMEYPMMTNDGIGQNKEGAAGVTVHEIAHTYLPFYVGANEEKYAWMDEGWAVLATYGGLKYIFPDTNARDRDGLTLSSAMGREDELPQGINSNIISGGEGRTYAVAAYSRAGVALDFLRNALGDEQFAKCVKEFMERWKYKHPTQYDFFYTFNNVSGENLDWFWTPWFFQRGYADLLIKEVNSENGIVNTKVVKEGRMPVPVVLTYYFEDGTSFSKSYSVSIWKDGKTEFTDSYKTEKKIKSIELGTNEIPDSNKENNKFVLIPNIENQ